MQFAGKFAGRGSEMGQKKREEGMARAKDKPEDKAKPRSERGKSASAASRTGVAPGRAKERPGKSGAKGQGGGKTRSK
jgi:hypothetical protein